MNLDVTVENSDASKTKSPTGTALRFYRTLTRTHRHSCPQDFGLAKIVRRKVGGRLTQRYEMTGETGSTRYMCPEVALQMPYNEKVCTLFVSVRYGGGGQAAEGAGEELSMQRQHVPPSTYCIDFQGCAI